MFTLLDTAVLVRDTNNANFVNFRNAIASYGSMPCAILRKLSEFMGDSMTLFSERELAFTFAYAVARPSVVYRLSSV